MIRSSVRCPVVSGQLQVVHTTSARWHAKIVTKLLVRRAVVWVTRLVCQIVRIVVRSSDGCRIWVDQMVIYI